ncbi:patatin-like phospholipase family protein [Jeotgalibacillus sp. S-D1]|uniref:patatin-like phospholipase family protein n=1 Tax=Jeotgalibacillus sp. S-D1 TaxID=2552189 RepID=UPI0014047A26|nr:patatin-like phospholipase family protein [Jeotgalibacillus sp. S-D1]
MIIDLVFSGGGVKAIAFIGVVEALEERGIKVRRVAGTSAGAIVGALVAAGYTSTEIKSMLPTLSHLFFKENNQKSWVPSWLRWLRLYWKKGLYTGDGLLDWLEQKLKDKGIRRFCDLPYGSFKMVASDLTAGKMIVLPDDAINYDRDPQLMNVAKAVRMSASLPFFYEPVRLMKGKQVHLIVDGGVLSNFPIWLLEEKGADNTIPIIGFQLQTEDKKQVHHKINNVIELYSALFITMKEAHDARHLEKIGKRNVLIIPVPSISLTNAYMSANEMHALIETGRACTLAYLDEQILQ